MLQHLVNKPTTTKLLTANYLSKITQIQTFIDKRANKTLRNNNFLIAIR